VTATQQPRQGGSILGTRVERVEDPVFLTRGATYVDDVVDPRLDGAVHLTLVRSPHAHARITGIDVAEARSAPGVVAVVTAGDLDRRTAKETEQPWLAGDVVRFVGEPVVAVLTERRYEGEDAAELVEVDYEPLPAVVDPREAAKDETLLYPDRGTNTAIELGGETEPDPDLFADCDVVASAEIVNQRVAPAPMEPRGGAAAWTDDGRLTVWCPSQGAQEVRDQIARELDVSSETVHIITPDVGGAFGARFGADPEQVLVARLAGHLSRPVRWVETRSENLVGMTHGRAQRHTVTIGGSRDGDVTAYRLDILQDAGAYQRVGAVLPALTRLMASGVYAIAKVESRARSVYTDTTPVGAYRGAGRPEATAAIERAIDLFAAEAGLDPAEVRRRNLVPPDAFPYTTPAGATYDSGDYAGALDRVLDAADYAGLRREQAQRREGDDAVQLGIGLSTYVEITGGGETGSPREDASVEVHEDGTVTVLTGTSPHGQGHATAWAMLASEELGVPVERITVRHGDTDLVPVGSGTGGSRSLQLGGAAVAQGAKELIELARERAAELLEAAPGDVVYDRGTQCVGVAGTPGAQIALAELAGRQRLAVDTTFTTEAATFPFGAHLAVVELDVESGQALLRQVVTVDDAGTILNPLLTEGQRHGGIAQGAAQALYEKVAYDDDGNPVTSTFADYSFITAPELPSFDLLTMQTPTTLNPLGAKGIGEAATIGSTPAVQNAVVDAVAHFGVRHLDMPAGPERIWQAIQETRQKGDA
jgi:carbon-monoxide dehydrogenase large subunit